MGKMSNPKSKALVSLVRIIISKIENVQCIEGFPYNLLSVSKLCDNGFELFSNLTCVNPQEKLFSLDQVFFFLYILDLYELPTGLYFISIKKIDK